MLRAYSEKERIIFESTMRLVGQGADLSAVKASDIAQAAGIGKGTLYNYFTSKEQIIAETLFYHAQLCLDRLDEAIEAQAAFQAQVYAAMQVVQGMLQHKNVMLRLLGFSMSSGGGPSHLRQSSAALMGENRARITRMLDALLDAGARQQVIAFTDRAYARQALAGALMGFVAVLCGGRDAQVPDTQACCARAMENAYAMLLRSFA
nr:TetR/AcrR family transcriptional regulator [Maliibacterium massiliense]